MIEPDELIHRRSARATLNPTRANPPPWFVGGGRGIMLLVLGITAILLVVRGVTFWWLVEEWWAWWNAPFTMERPASAPVLAPPPADPRKGPAYLRGNPGSAFGPDSYPPEAIRQGQQGRTVAVLTVDASGTPVRCTVKTSSGSRALDRATCTTALARVRFEPARDNRGAPIASHYTLPVRWVLPDS